MQERTIHPLAAAGVDKPERLIRLTLLVVCLFGFGLRLYRLGASSLWYDEGVSLLLAGKSIPAMLAHTAGDIHPPLYYGLLHGWLAVAGASEFSAGFFSLWFGVLLVVLVYRLGRTIIGRVEGLLAAFLVAISPYHVWYSQELRMYTLGAALGLLALMGLWAGLYGVVGQDEIGADGARRLGWRRAAGWAGYTLAAVAGMYTLYYFAFLLFALNLWALIVIIRQPATHRLKLVGAWLAANLGALILYLPWAGVFIRQAIHPPVPPWREFVPLGRVIVEAWTALTAGHSVEPSQIWPLLLLSAGLSLAGIYRLARRRRLDAFLVGGYLFIPLAVIYLVSWVVPLYHVRYVFTYSPAFYILLAIGLRPLFTRRRLWGVGAIVLGAFAIGSALSIWQYHFDPRYAPDDHRGAVRYLDEHWRPGDAILVNAGYVYPPLVYYTHLPIAWRGRLTEYGVAFQRDQAPAGVALFQTGSVDGPASLGWGSASSDFYAASRADTHAALERLFADYERVWVYRCYDTVTDPDGFIRAWLDEHGLKFDETPAFAGLSNIRVQGYLTRRQLSANAPEGSHAISIRFGGRLELLAVEGAPAWLKPGAPLDVALWWWHPETDGPALPRLATTLRLVDRFGRLWAQSDEHPLGNQYRTTDWPAGVVVRQPARLQVPSGLVPGAYDLLVGVYEAESGATWTTADGKQLIRLTQLGAPADTSAGLAHQPAAIFDGGVALLEANGPREVQAGHELHLTLEWQTLEGLSHDWIVFVQLLDQRGKPVAMEESPPADGQLPTSRWIAGQRVREQRDLYVPADTPAGNYRLILGMYLPTNGKRLERNGFWPWERGDHWTFGIVRVNTRPAQIEKPFEPAYIIQTYIGPQIELVGYDLDPSQAMPGGRLKLKLLWRAAKPAGGNYKVFCHLVGDAGQIWGQADGVPAGGRMPTLTWMTGEYVVDEHVIAIPSDAPAGDYRLLVGLYDPRTGQRPGEPAHLQTLRLP